MAQAPVVATVDEVPRPLNPQPASPIQTTTAAVRAATRLTIAQVCLSSDTRHSTSSRVPSLGSWPGVWDTRQGRSRLLSAR